MIPLAQFSDCSSPFDAIAEQYDNTFTSSAIGKAQRTAVWKELTKSFHPGSRILDIGCGTGVDACFLAERNVDVVACDSSARMLSIAERRIAGLPHGKGTGSVQLHLLPAEKIYSLIDEGSFDGALSNFGAINCVEDIAQLGSDLARLLDPGASLLLCLMGQQCLWEMAWYILHGKAAKGLRRLRRGGVEARLSDDAVIRVHYPSVRFMRRILAPQFCLMAIRGIGVTVPPSYLEAWASRVPGMVKLGARVDQLLGQCPGVRMFADHLLLRFERTRA